jgi:hypothetical protein
MMAPSSNGHGPLDYTQQNNRFGFDDPLPPADMFADADGRARYNVLSPRTYWNAVTMHVAWVTVDPLSAVTDEGER